MNDLEPLDTALHAPARLQLAAVLAKVSQAEFARLREILEVSDSVLSKHLSALREIGYVDVGKTMLDGRRCTWASLTTKGRKAFAAHMRALHRLAEAAEQAADSVE